MKTLNSKSVIYFLLTMVCVLLVGPIFAQNIVDTTVTLANGNPINDSTAVAHASEVVSNVTTFFGFVIPDYVKAAMTSLVIMLPSVQYILKRVPSTNSVKIQGILGKVLDLLTFFQKDKKDNGGFHK